MMNLSIEGINDYEMNETSVVKDIVHIEVGKNGELVVEEAFLVEEFSKIVETLIQDAISNYYFANDYKEGSLFLSSYI